MLRPRRIHAMSNVDERTRRIGHNEALFRQVNDRIEDLAGGSVSPAGVFDIVCECGDITCTEHLTLAPQVYEQARAAATRFVVVPGHVVDDLESVVDRGPGYEIIEKITPEARDVAEQTNRRNGTEEGPAAVR